MRVNLKFVSNEGEEPSDGFDFEMPDVPRPGDRITIQRPGQEGTSDFIVRRRLWILDYPECAPAHHHAGESVTGAIRAVTVECEFAAGPYSSEEHKRVAADRVP